MREGSWLEGRGGKPPAQRCSPGLQRALPMLDLNLATLDWEVSVSRTQRNPEVGLVRGQGERLCSVDNV